MSHSTISTFQLFEMFPDMETARVYLESRLWPNGVRCPFCGLGERITTRKGGFYRCNGCKQDFTVRTGTIFERSHVPLHKWVYAMYLVVTARKGVSSMQLAKEIGVTQKTAWFVLGRLREACGDNFKKLSGLFQLKSWTPRHSNSRSLIASKQVRQSIATNGVDTTACGISATNTKPSTIGLEITRATTLQPTVSSRFGPC